MCVRDCPGNLMVLRPDGIAAIRDNSDCWDCAACIKVCPSQAIHMQLPTAVIVRGVELRGRALRSKTEWHLRLRNGEERTYETPSSGSPPFIPNL
jgi:adenylylsulfate reductase subunit B